MTLPGVGSHLQSDSSNDPEFIKNSLQARRPHFEDSATPSEDLPTSVLQRRSPCVIAVAPFLEPKWSSADSDIASRASSRSCQGARRLAGESRPTTWPSKVKLSTSSPSPMSTPLLWRASPSAGSARPGATQPPTAGAAGGAGASPSPSGPGAAAQGAAPWRRPHPPERLVLPEEPDEEPRAASAAVSRSASEPQLPSRTATGACSVAASSQASCWSPRSLRSKIGEAVEQEAATSALGDYFEFLKKHEQIKRKKALDMPMHLRTGPNPIDMGCPRSMETEAHGAMAMTVKKAVDPKWSTQLKKINDRVGQRLEYQSRLSAPLSIISPELPHMFPKKYMSNPPTPYFQPGQRGW